MFARAVALRKISPPPIIQTSSLPGLDAASAIYEWNYQRQLLSIRAATESGVSGDDVEDRIFSDDAEQLPADVAPHRPRGGLRQRGRGRDHGVEQRQRQRGTGAAQERSPR